MLLRITRLLFALTLSAFSIERLRADMFPGYSVDKMCDKADAIIAGEYLGNDEVMVEEVLKSHNGVIEKGKKLHVETIEKHDRKPDAFWEFDLDGKKKVADLAVKKLILFLDHDGKQDKWFSLATIDADGGCGSCGLFWHDEKNCYGYIQAMNPGPYCLVTGAKARIPRIPKTEKELREAIRVGLLNLDEWRKAVAITDEDKKAKALARYLLKSTSPPSDKGSYRIPAETELSLMGKESPSRVIPLVLKNLEIAKPDDDVTANFYVLQRVDKNLKDRLPILHEVLSKTTLDRNIYHALSIVESFKDRSSIEPLRPLLDHELDEVSRYAARILILFDEPDLFSKVESRLPQKFKTFDDFSNTYERLAILYRIDPKKAVPLIKRILAQEPGGMAQWNEKLRALLPKEEK